MNPISFRGNYPITYLSGSKKEVRKIAKEMHLIPVVTGEVKNDVLAVGLPKKLYEAFKKIVDDVKKNPNETKSGYNTKILGYLGIIPGFAMPVVSSKH